MSNKINVTEEEANLSIQIEIKAPVKTVRLNLAQKNQFEKFRRSSRAVKLLNERLEHFKNSQKTLHKICVFTYKPENGLEFEVAKISEGKGKPGFDLEGLEKKHPDIFKEFYIKATPNLSFRFS